MDRRMASVWGLIGLVSVFVGEIAAFSHEVGDGEGWMVPNDPLFYETWASTKSFVAGDEIVFKWTGVHNVVEATEDEYDKCTKTGKPHETSPVTIPLTAAGSRFFICSVGPHCSLGQKVNVTVGPQKSTTPPPPSSSAPASLAATALSATIFIVAIIFFTCI